MTAPGVSSRKTAGARPLLPHLILLPERMYDTRVPRSTPLRRRWLRWAMVYVGGVLALAVIGLVIEAAVRPRQPQPCRPGRPGFPGVRRRAFGNAEPGAEAPSRAAASPLSGPLQVVQGRELINGVYLGFPHSTAGAVSAADYVVSEVFSTLDPDRAAAVMRLTAAPSYPDAPQQAAQGAVSDRQDLGIPAAGPVPAGLLAAGPAGGVPGPGRAPRTR